MEIKNAEYYHIHRIGDYSKLWQIGNRINWVQKRFNLFFDFYNKNGLFYDDGTGPLPIKKAIERFKNGNTAYKNQQVVSIINVAEAVIKDQAMFIRETIFEEVRKNYFPHLPSRLHCIWVCEPEAVDFWWNSLNSPNQIILKLKLTGTLHEADERHLVSDSFKHDDLRAKAFEYWTGTDGTELQGKEILFEGIIDVIESFNSIEDFNNRLL